jgi:signal transduction histidine kinase
MEPSSQPVVSTPDVLLPFEVMGALPAPPPTMEAHQHHSVQFYENDHFLAAAIADYLAMGLRAGQVVVAITTTTHRESFMYRLRAKSIDPDAALRSGRIIWLDARETLASFMSHATPKPELFEKEVGSVIESCVRSAGPAGVRAYGEMVDLLWKEGNVDGAVRLEELWNALQHRHAFSLLCAYAMGNFYKSSHSEAFQRVCQAHTHVLPSERYLDLEGPARMREVSLLQQRARALETEIEYRTELEQRLRVALASKIHAEEELRRALSDREVLLERERAARAEAESASRAKNEFLAVMSHELRTPLNAIGGHVQLLEMGIHGQIVEAQREALLRIERSQRHLLALINDILNLTRIEAGRVQYMLEDIPLEPLVLEVKALLDPLLSSHTLSLEVDTSIKRLGSRRISVRADREKVQQILLNLLSNAIKFTPAGGRIGVHVGVGSDTSRSAYVQVTDTGIGIDAAKLETIFQPFVQLAAHPVNRPDGVGLGLSISRDLARGMEGDLSVQSVVGAGSTFTLTLPIA